MKAQALVMNAVAHQSGRGHKPVSYTHLGCILWVGCLVSAGFFLGNLDWVRQNFSIIVYAIVVVSVLPVAIEVLRSRFGGKKGAVDASKKE